MYCYGCGMESRTNDVCEWCKKPMTAGARGGQSLAGQPLGVQPPAGRPLGQPLGAPLNAPLDQTQPVPQPAVQTRVSLTGEVIEEPVAPVAPAVPPPYPGTGPAVAPAAVDERFGPRSLRGSTAGQAVVAGLPPGAVSAHAVAAEMRDFGPSIGQRWELALAFIMPLVLGAVCLVHFVPTAYMWTELGTLFAVAVILGATGAIGSYDEEFLDCTAVLVISYFLGPLVGFGAYLLFVLIRQDGGAAISFLLLTHILVRLAMILAGGATTSLQLYTNTLDWAMVLPHFEMYSVGAFVSFFVVCSTFAGWMISNFFRPVNE
jgi:hypothetical protein